MAIESNLGGLYERHGYVVIKGQRFALKRSTKFCLEPDNKWYVDIETSQRGTRFIKALRGKASTKIHLLFEKYGNGWTVHTSRAKYVGEQCIGLHRFLWSSNRTTHSIDWLPRSRKQRQLMREVGIQS